MPGPHWLECPVPVLRASLAIVLCVVALAGSACRRSTLPDALTDRDFWGLIETLSEPAGAFTLSENFVSNEPHFADTVRRLRASGGAYIGVGPEQNFSYIAKLRPRIAFIIDIRRENLALLLFYKALFELSTDRADFVSRLFSRPRPPSSSRMRTSRKSSASTTVSSSRRSSSPEPARSSANACSPRAGCRCRRAISTGSTAPSRRSTTTGRRSTITARARSTRSVRRTGS